MLKMFFIPLMLVLTTSSIDATFPELPDMDSFIQPIFEMVPVNGQLRVNDQIFHFGSTTTPSSDISSEIQEVLPPVDSSQTPNSLPETPAFDSRGSESLPLLPNALPEPQNNKPINEQNFDSRTQPIADSFPQSFPNSQNFPSNFETRIPSLDSILSNMRSPQNSVFNSLPNIGSTEMGSTFARNANSDFRDEFSQPPASTPVPFGFPGPSAANEVRSNIASTESPLVVVPLMVSPDSLLQRNGMSSNPLPIPALFASANNDERMSASERVESFPVSVEPIFGERTTNESADDSAQVVSRQSTIVVPPSMFRELTNESLPSQRNLDAELDRHVLTILRNTNTTGRTAAPITFDGSLFRTQEMPTLTEVEETEKQRSQSTPKTESSEESIES